MLFGFETNFECLFITGHVKLVILECDVEMRESCAAEESVMK